MTEMILPPVGRDFRWSDTRFGSVLVCRALEPLAHHMFTTRLWALGSSPSGQTNGWRDIAEGIETAPARLLRVRQVHGSHVVVHRDGEALPGRIDADILVSNDATAALAVQTADCIPLLIADARTGSVAASHAGWRGLVSRVPSVTVTALAEAFGSHPSDLVVAIGPSIGSCCYEVGDDVRQQFEAEGFSTTQLSAWFGTDPRESPANPGIAPSSRERQGRWFLDLWRVAFDQLLEAGVAPDRVHTAGLCTASHPASFCSYRREGARAGRLAGVIRARPQQS
jgi:polyphenol oxidase